MTDRLRENRRRDETRMKQENIYGGKKGKRTRGTEWIVVREEGFGDHVTE